MAGQLIPVPELDPPATRNLTAAERIAVWFDLLDFGEELVVIAKRRELGHNLDRHEAVKRWYAESLVEHDGAIRQMMEELHQRGAAHGC